VAMSAAQITSLHTEITGLRREVDKLRQRSSSETGRADRAERAVTEVREQLGSGVGRAPGHGGVGGHPVWHTHVGADR